MSEENQRLTLGEVQKEDLKFQPALPQDELTAYFRDTDLGTILDDMTANGTEPDAAMAILQRRGYDPEEVNAFRVNRYEEQRRQFLKQQEEERKRQEEEQRRVEGMSAQSEAAVPEEKVVKLETATEDEYGQPVSIARPEIAKVYQKEGILGDPTSPTSLPKDLVDAMDRGEDPTLRYQSYENDRNIFDVWSQHNLARDFNDAIKNQDVESYNEIARELSDMGIFVQEVDSLDGEYSDIQMSVFDSIDERKKEAIEERNKINSSFGLPSGFNPDSDTDFLYAMKESLMRQEADFNSSEYKEYLDEVEEGAIAMLQRSDALDSIILGKDGSLDIAGNAIEAVIQGFTKKFLVPIVQTATVSLPAMYYEATGQMGKYNAKMLANRKFEDIMSRERQMRLMQRGLSDFEASAGVSELFESMLDGDVSIDNFFNRVSYEVGEGFGQAIGYMVPIGRAGRALSSAKATVSRTAAAAAGKSVPRGVGVLTGEAAASARAIDAASKASRALTIANRKYNAVFTALGVNSGAGVYRDLYDRKDLSFAEKMIQSTIVGVAEATLGKMFSNVDKLFVGGARGMSKAAALKDLKKMTEEKLKQLTTRAGAKKALGVTSKGLREEFLEEFGVELVQQGVEIINDVAMGRKPKEINWHALIDAGLAGMFGAGPTSVMAGVGTFQAHNSMLKRRRQLVDELGDIQDAIDNETDPETRKQLEKLRDFATVQIREIDGESRKAFSKMSEGQRRRLLKIHRDMAYTEAKLKDPNISKEEREQLKKRYENLLRAKTTIENSESEVEPDMTSGDEVVSSQDASGNDVDVETQPVKRLERNNIKLAEEAREPAPKGQEQEAEQLSLFDETQDDQFEEVEEEAPAQEEAPAKEEAPVAEEAAEPVDDSEYDDFDADGIIDVTDPSQVGEDGKMTLEQALQTNALGKALGQKLREDGFTIRRYKTRAAFNKAQKLDEADAGGGGFVNFGTKTINLAPDATAREIQEEFAHAAFRDILGENAPQRRELYLYLQDLAKTNSGVEKAFRDVNRAYEGAPQAEIEEEVIVEVLLKYAEGSLDFNKQEKTGVRRLINAILAVFQTGRSEVALENDKEFRRFAQSFKRSVGGKQRVDPRAFAPKIKREQAFNEQDLVKKDTESEAEFRARVERITTEGLGDVEGTTVSEEDALSQDTEDIETSRGVRRSRKRKTDFNYLKDTEVFYTEDAYVDIGESKPTFERAAQKKIKVNDYFHFRNWFNHMTANGRRPGRITQMYFIKDGKKYTIKPPKPKTDRDGNVVYMDGAEHGSITRAKRYYGRQNQSARRVNEAREAVFELGRQIDDALKSAGLDGVGGMAFFPGFDYAAFEQINDRDEQISFMYEAKQAAIFSKTPDQMYEVLEVIEANFDALKNSGMSVDELRAADKSKVFNMTGLVPAHMADSGKATHQGTIRRSRKRKPNPAAFTRKAKERGGIMVSPDSFVGVIARNLGYDLSGVKIGSGLIDQVGKTADGSRVISSHYSDTYARTMRNRLRSMAEEDYNSKNPKGYFILTFAALEEDSLAGNPAIFEEIVKEYANVNGRRLVDAVNDLLSEEGAFAKKNYTALMKASVFTQSRAGSALLARMESLDDIGKRVQVETVDEAQVIISALANQRFDSEGMDQNFDDRNSLAKRILGREYKQKIASFIAPEMRNRMAGAAMMAVKVPYTVQEVDGQTVFGGWRAVDLESKGIDVTRIGRKGGKKGGPFNHAIVYDVKEGDTPNKYFGKVTAEDLAPQIFTEQVPLSEAYESSRTKADEKKGTESEFFFSEKYQETEEATETREKFGAGRGLSGRLFETQQQSRDAGITDHSLRRSRKRGFKMDELSGFQKWKNKWIKRLQDKYVDIFAIQETIERQTGKLDTDKDFKMAEELMYGKAAEDLAKLDQRVDAITAAMKKAGIKVDVLSEYMYALHAKERNAVIAKRTNGGLVDGSGMTDAEADAILNSANKASLDPIVALVREIQQDTRKTMVKHGLETQQTVDAFEAMFSNYIPLAGLSTDELTGSPYPTGGAGMNVFGPSTKRAEGRKSKAENVLAQVIAQNAAMHIKGRTNEALQKLHNLIDENPNPKVWRILDAKDVTDVNDSRLVAVRVNGEQKFIYFNDASYAETLRGMNLPQSNAFVRALRAPAQWLRASFTTLNPEFVISNFSRDIQSAIFNASAEAEIEGGMLNNRKTVARIFRLVPDSLKTLTKNAVNRKGDPAIEKYFQEFKEDGGKTGWAYAKPLDQLASELESNAEGKTKTQEILGKAKNFGEFIEGINDAFENSIRLASYIAARENGVSREKAAQLAKNITVNFNKQGEWGPTLNAVYLFFNASVQGTARLGRSLLSLRPQKRPDGTDRKAYERITSAQWMAGGLSVFASMLTALGYAMSDEDEDGIPYWDKIPDYVKERNLVIMRPNGKDYFKIPMPYGFNVFANMGTAMTEAAYGGREADEAMMFLFNSFMASFSPVSFGQSKDLFTSVGKGAVPTVMKPFVDVMVNETYFGGPVTGENLPFGVQRPESELAFRSPEAVKDFFKWMNEATGGSEFKPGDLDFNPDKFWYMFQYYIGGAGQFVDRSLFKFPKQLQAKLFSEEDVQIDAGQVPLARILYGQPSKYFDMEKFKENEQEFKSLYKEAKESPRLDDLARYKGINPSTNSLFNKIKKQLSMLRKAQYEARKIDDYAQRTARIQELKDKERSLIMKWNKFYEQARN